MRRDESTTTTERSGAEEAVRRLAERYWEQLLEVEPTIGTWIGDDRYDDRLPDPSDEGRGRRETIHRAALEEASRIDAADVEEDLRTALDVLRAVAERELSDIEHRLDRISMVAHLFGPSNLVAQLASVQRADTPERLEKYERRLRAMPEYFERVGEVAREGVDAGQTVPGLVVDRTIAQVERFLAMPPEESPAMQPLASASQEDRDRVVAALREAVYPAHEGFLEVLREYRPHARESVGLSQMPGGEEAYRALIRSYTTLDLDPKTIHEIGNEQLALIHDERQRIAERLGFADVDAAIADLTESGRDVAKTREEFLRLIEDQVRRSWEAAPQWFGRLPRANCEVRPVEEYREDDMPGAFYNAPTADGSRPGVYYVNSGSLEERPLHQTATTSFHEANPGHHFQLSIEVEHQGRLPLRRFGGLLVGDSFIEGWGLYSELLADEMGLFLDDYERLGMLEAQGLRAGRLIVDTGLHAFGWDRERAVRQMQDTGASRLDAEIEVDRYIAVPGQALAYMVGRLEIQRWRREAAARDGDAFSLREFHDRVLSLGSLPLPALARELGATVGP